MEHNSGQRAHASTSQDDEARCLAITYDYVHDSDPLTPSGLRGLTSRNFKVQLDRLCDTMEPIDWPTLYAGLSRRVSLPQRCFLLTFDGGLADHANVVFPILEERGLRGTFFIPGQVLTRHRLLAVHEVHLLLANLGDHRLLDETGRYLADHNGDRDWIGETHRAAAEAIFPNDSPNVAQLFYLLTIALPMELRTALVDSLFERHVGSSARWAQDWYLGWEQLAQMQSAGQTVGAHGYHDESYATLSSCQRLEDMVRVARVLNDGLGPDFRPLSYPFGSWDVDTAANCRRSGFAHGFTMHHDWIRTSCDPFQLPRIDTAHVDTALAIEQTASPACSNRTS